MRKHTASNKEKAIKHAFKVVSTTNAYHPIQDYIKSIQWDGQPRVETSLIDYLGAEDNEYTRAVTNVTFIGAVERVFNKGCKFDTMRVLVGNQGQGKSTFVNKIGVKWSSDSLTTFKGKEACEQIQGGWIIEVAELSGMKKVEIETIKHFISKKSDNFRQAYAEFTKDNPRQCVFIGTTNTYKFLKDVTGNRRFYPVDLINKPTKSVMKDLTAYEVGQMWAEAYQMHLQGQISYLEDSEILKTALEKQNEHFEEHPYQGRIEEFIDLHLPLNWKDMNITDRLKYLRDLKDDDPLKPNLKPEETYKRDKVCILEIWTELLGGQLKDINRTISNDIKDCIIRTGKWEPSKSNLRFGKIYGQQRGFKRIKED